MLTHKTSFRKRTSLLNVKKSEFGENFFAHFKKYLNLNLIKGSGRKYI